MEGRLGDHHSGELHRASAEAKAERIIAEELKRQGWQEAALLVRPKNDAVKLEMAARLRRETTLSTKAIAARVPERTHCSVTRRAAPPPGEGAGWPRPGRACSPFPTAWLRLSSRDISRRLIS
jgi:hypothetical protein